MPFLRAAQRAKELPKISKPVLHQVSLAISGVCPVENPQLSLFPKKLDTRIELSGTNKEKGTKYEKYVGSLYEESGYDVRYYGKEKGSLDRGLDLICRKDIYTVLVQCKYHSNADETLKLKDIYYFYGSSLHYAMQNPDEVVQRSYWTNVKVLHSSKVFRAIIELGILLYDGTSINYVSK